MSQASSIIESEIVPFVRSGGTAIVPVRDAFRCKLLRLRDEDVVPREKIGCEDDYLLHFTLNSALLLNSEGVGR